MDENSRTTLVLLAAGMGSRYGGVKQIDGVGPNGEALIDYSIFDALRAGFTDLCFVVRAEIRDSVEAFFAGKFPPGVRVSYAVQSLDDVPAGCTVPKDRAKPWGTAHAVFAARSTVSTPFAVVNADDFYGRSSYATLHEWLVRPGAQPNDFAMIGFRLAETLSPHGTVSRGICSTSEDGYLLDIVEHKKVSQEEHGIESHMDDGTVVRLPADTTVSMNMFGFTPAVFPLIETEFSEFLEKHGEDPKSEFYIPTLMTGLINAGRARMRVLPTSSGWFGMTYHEDRDAVQKRIRERVERGDYPRRLWEGER